MHKKDSVIFGIVVGLLVPVAFYFILYFGLELVEEFFYRDWLNERPALKLISIVINLFLIRYYLVRLKFEKTGKAVLFVTFAYVIAYFIFYPPA